MGLAFLQQEVPITANFSQKLVKFCLSYDVGYHEMVSLLSTTLIFAQQKVLRTLIAFGRRMECMPYSTIVQGNVEMLLAVCADCQLVYSPRERKLCAYVLSDCISNQWPSYNREVMARSW